MNRKQWTTAYRAYRILSKLAKSDLVSEPEFPLTYNLGKFACIIRHSYIVANTHSGFKFSVKTWLGKHTQIAPKSLPSIEWADGTLCSRWVGFYLLIASAYFPD